MAQHDGMVQRGLRLSLDALGIARRRLNGLRDKRRDTYRGNAADATIYLNKAHDVSSVQGERRGGERILAFRHSGWIFCSSLPCSPVHLRSPRSFMRIMKAGILPPIVPGTTPDVVYFS
ncbi:hypothetical protein ALC57_09609 [Trachymyrmex cornetzi]|uniref:Uncharacterized protein n=1 Tax=Trachymyrmex cornetzi TaxID=471704 RepID=A0A195DZ46_9HYME|nr:hypothetical protein ALC57_09609 [Trachymyrmex cornetzi]